MYLLVGIALFALECKTRHHCRVITDMHYVEQNKSIYKDYVHNYKISNKSSLKQDKEKLPKGNAKAYTGNKNKNY